MSHRASRSRSRAVDVDSGEAEPRTTRRSASSRRSSSSKVKSSTAATANESTNLNNSRGDISEALPTPTVKSSPTPTKITSRSRSNSTSSKPLNNSSQTFESPAMTRRRPTGVNTSSTASASAISIPSIPTPTPRAFSPAARRLSSSTGLSGSAYTTSDGLLGSPARQNAARDARAFGIHTCSEKNCTMKNVPHTHTPATLSRTPTGSIFDATQTQLPPVYVQSQPHLPSQPQSTFSHIHRLRASNPQQGPSQHGTSMLQTPQAPISSSPSSSTSEPENASIVETVYDICPFLLTQSQLRATRTIASAVGAKSIASWATRTDSILTPHRRYRFPFKFLLLLLTGYICWKFAPPAVSFINQQAQLRPPTFFLDHGVNAPLVKPFPLATPEDFSFSTFFSRLTGKFQEDRHGKNGQKDVVSHPSHIAWQEGSAEGRSTTASVGHLTQLAAATRDRLASIDATQAARLKEIEKTVESQLARVAEAVRIRATHEISLARAEVERTLSDTAAKLQALVTHVDVGDTELRHELLGEIAAGDAKTVETTKNLIAEVSQALSSMFEKRMSEQISQSISAEAVLRNNAITATKEHAVALLRAYDETPTPAAKARAETAQHALREELTARLKEASISETARWSAALEELRKDAATATVEALRKTEEKLQVSAVSLAEIQAKAATKDELKQLRNELLTTTKALREATDLAAKKAEEEAKKQVEVLVLRTTATASAAARQAAEDILRQVNPSSSSAAAAAEAARKSAVEGAAADTRGIIGEASLAQATKDAKTASRAAADALTAFHKAEAAQHAAEKAKDLAVTMAVEEASKAVSKAVTQAENAVHATLSTIFDGSHKNDKNSAWAIARAGILTVANEQTEKAVTTLRTALSTQMKDLETSILATVRREWRDDFARLESSIGSKIDSTKATLAELEVSMRQHNQEFGEITRRVTSQETKLSASETKVNRNAAEVERLAQRVSELEKTLAEGFVASTVTVTESSSSSPHSTSGSGSSSNSLTNIELNTRLVAARAEYMSALETLRRSLEERIVEAVAEADRSAASRISLSEAKADVRIKELNAQFQDLSNSLSGLSNSVAALSSLSKNTSGNRANGSTSTSATTSTSTSTSGITREDLQNEISTALEVFAADRVGRADYAQRAAGGRIISASPTFTPTTEFSGLLSWLGQNQAPQRPPELIIEPSAELGSCWPMQGTHGFAVLRLARPIRIEAVTLQHLSSLEALAKASASAPRAFKVYGITQAQLEETEKEKRAGGEKGGRGTEPQGTLLGSFTYSLDQGKAVQTFELVPSVAARQAYQYVKLEVLSNYGNKDFTCLYRFRVHGTPTQ